MVKWKNDDPFVGAVRAHSPRLLRKPAFCSVEDWAR